MAKIGIDFGTTNSSLVAFSKTKGFEYPMTQTEERLNPQGTLPSFWYQNGKKTEVGFASKQENTKKGCGVKSVKSELGKGGVLEGTSKTPSEVAGDIIKTLIDLSKAKCLAFGVDPKLNSAVLTVPISFNAAQRHDLREAAKKAGITDVITFVHEPFAAVVGYFYKEIQELKGNEKSFVLVFDWGGGTLDITVVEVVGRSVEEDVITTGTEHIRVGYYISPSGTLEGGMKAVDVNRISTRTYLYQQLFQRGTSELSNSSGDQFDEKFAQWLYKVYYESTVKLPFDKIGESDRKTLVSGAEKCKVELSDENKAEFDGGRINGIEIKREVTRIDFENHILEDYIKEAIKKIDEAILDANITKNRINHVLLVGGSSKIPAVEARIKKEFGAGKVIRPQKPDWLIAEGAAVIAEMGWKPELLNNYAVRYPDGMYNSASFPNRFNQDMPAVGMPDILLMGNSKDLFIVEIDQTKKELINRNAGRLCIDIIDKPDGVCANCLVHRAGEWIPFYLKNCLMDSNFTDFLKFWREICWEVWHWEIWQQGSVQHDFMRRLKGYLSQDKIPRDFFDILKLHLETLMLEPKLDMKRKPATCTLDHSCIYDRLYDYLRESNVPSDIPNKLKVIAKSKWLSPKVTFELDKDLILNVTDNGVSKVKIHDLRFALRIEEGTPNT